MPEYNPPVIILKNGRINIFYCAHNFQLEFSYLQERDQRAARRRSAKSINAEELRNIFHACYVCIECLTLSTEHIKALCKSANNEN